MKKVVLDTNVIISGLFWNGNEAKILKKAENKEIHLFTSFQLLEELEKVLSREKFSKNLKNKEYSLEQAVLKFSLSVTVIESRNIVDVIKNDPDDNRVLECALSAKAEVIISGDSDLLNLKNYSGIEIISAKKFLNQSK